MRCISFFHVNWLKHFFDMANSMFFYGFFFKPSLNKGSQQDFSTSIPDEKHCSGDMAAMFCADWICGSQLLAGTRSSPECFGGSATLTRGHQKFSHTHIYVKFEENSFKGYSRTLKSPSIPSAGGSSGGSSSSGTG